jgi:hypothetical protein
MPLGKPASASKACVWNYEPLQAYAVHFFCYRACAGRHNCLSSQTPQNRWTEVQFNRVFFAVLVAKRCSSHSIRCLSMRFSAPRPSPSSLRARAPPRRQSCAVVRSYFGKDGLAGQLGGQGNLEDLLRGQQPLDLGGATAAPPGAPGEDDPLNFDPEGVESSSCATQRLPKSLQRYLCLRILARLFLCALRLLTVFCKSAAQQIIQCV